MVCHSYTGTMKLLNNLSDNYDEKVLYWSESLIPVLTVSKHKASVQHSIIIMYSIA